MWPILANSKPGMGLMGAFVGLKWTAEELGLTAQNILYTNTNDLEKVTHLELIPLWLIIVIVIGNNFVKNIFFIGIQ